MRAEVAGSGGDLGEQKLQWTGSKRQCLLNSAKPQPLHSRNKQTDSARELYSVRLAPKRHMKTEPVWASKPAMKSQKEAKKLNCSLMVLVSHLSQGLGVGRGQNKTTNVHEGLLPRKHSLKC